MAWVVCWGSSSAESGIQAWADLAVRLEWSLLSELVPSSEDRNLRVREVLTFMTRGWNDLLLNQHRY